jgi:hypothetical protein
VNAAASLHDVAFRSVRRRPSGVAYFTDDVTARTAASTLGFKLLDEDPGNGWMIAAGANPLQIAEALGHSDKTGRPDAPLVWKRYGHLYPGSTREAIAALDRHLGALAN